MLMRCRVGLQGLVSTVERIIAAFDDREHLRECGKRLAEGVTMAGRKIDDQAPIIDQRAGARRGVWWGECDEFHEPFRP